MSYVYRTIATPVGQLKAVARDNRLVGILWEHENAARVRLVAMERDDDCAILVKTEKQLGEYFDGTRTCFELELEFVEGTDFQKNVWTALLSIPFGETRTYGDIARQIGNPKAVRAVGGAANKNPISIVAPCHRVIGSNGALTGFGGGLPAKEILLAVEGVKPAPTSQACLFA